MVCELEKTKTCPLFKPVNVLFHCIFFSFFFLFFHSFSLDLPSSHSSLLALTDSGSFYMSRKWAEDTLICFLNSQQACRFAYAV